MPRKTKTTITLIETLLIRGKDGPSLATKVTDDSISACNMQSQSRLFGVLPPELRNHIFELSTQPYDDERHIYDPTAYYYRPGHHAKQRVDTALLLTCRRTWLEANHLPMSHIEPTFWFEWDQRRPDWTHHARERKSKYNLRHRRNTIYTTETTRYLQFMDSLSANNFNNLQSIHILGQLLWLESNSLSRLLRSSPDGMPTVPRVRVTVRHTDWWNWESGADLEISTSWIPQLLTQAWFGNSVKTFELHLETLLTKIDQLEAIIQGIKQTYSTIMEMDGDQCWKLDQKSGKEVLAWEGPTDIGGIGEYTAQSGEEKLEYRVYSLMWTCSSA